MSIFQATVLGAVQGLTEFIPISSSGHLVLVPAALDWSEPGLSFDVLLHTASLLALVVYFAGELLDLGRGVARRRVGSLRLLGLLVIGTIPAAALGVAAADFFEEAFTDERAAAIQLLITAVILVAGELALRYHRHRTAQAEAPLRSMDQLRYGDAGLIGVAQAVSILPGISRSGATIATGLGLAVERDDSARFAFLLAIPALAGAQLIDIPELFSGTLDLAPALAGFSAS